jgi:hypothetical protein
MPDELNGTFDMLLGPGDHIISAGSCSIVSKVVITETSRVVPSSFLG